MFKVENSLHLSPSFETEYLSPKFSSIPEETKRMKLPLDKVKILGAIKLSFSEFNSDFSKEAKVSLEEINSRQPSSFKIAHTMVPLLFTETE